MPNEITEAYCKGYDDCAKRQPFFNRKELTIIKGGIISIDEINILMKYHKSVENPSEMKEFFTNMIQDRKELAVKIEEQIQLRIIQGE